MMDRSYRHASRSSLNVLPHILEDNQGGYRNVTPSSPLVSQRGEMTNTSDEETFRQNCWDGIDERCAIAILSVSLSIGRSRPSRHVERNDLDITSERIHVTTNSLRFPHRLIRREVPPEFLRLRLEYCLITPTLTYTVRSTDFYTTVKSYHCHRTSCCSKLLP